MNLRPGKRSAFVRRFYLGPSWKAVRKNRSGRKYISPTYMLLYWTDAVFERFFTPQGRLMLIAYAQMAFFALLLTRSPAFLLFLLLTALLLLDAGCKLFFPRKIRLRRHLPGRVLCGIPFEIRTTVRNDSFLPGYDVAVNSNLSPELKRMEKLTEIRCLAPHSEVTFRQNYTLPGRGVYELPPTVAECVFPFRLVKAVRRDRLRQEIICHPVHTEFRNLTLPRGARIRSQSLSSTPSAGQSLDFLGCRDYRSGDDPRRIHWGASAKRNRLVIKEFQEEKQSCASIILDTFCPSPVRHPATVLKNLVSLKSLLPDSPDASFEAAVSLTASIARSLSVRNFMIDVFASGSEIHHFRTGRNTMNYEAFLDLLSALDFSRSEARFEQLAPAALNRIAAAGAVFLILTHLDPEAEKLYRELLKRGAEVRVFCFDDRPDPPVWAERLTCDEILRNRREEL